MQNKTTEMILSALVYDYLLKDYAELADKLKKKTKLPLLATDSPNLQKIVKFYLASKPIAVMYEEESDSEDVDQPKRKYMAYHAMRYYPVAVRSDPVESIIKNTSMIKKNVPCKSKQLARKKTRAPIKKMIQNKEETSVQNSPLSQEEKSEEMETNDSTD